MAVEQQFVGGLSESTLDARLDAIDQLLLGCIPRGERLAIVATVEEKLRSHCTTPTDQVSLDSQRATSAPGHPLAETMPYPAPSRALPGGIQLSIWKNPARPRRRRSKLAVASGILGLAAGALLFGTPVAYGLAAFFAELLDETFAIITLAAYAVLILFASGGAILAGLVALWRLRKRKEIGGRGWALTGLCTGPIPLGLTTLIGLYVGLQTIDMSIFFGSGSDASPAPASATAAEESGPYAIVPIANNSPTASCQPLEPGVPIRLASEPTTPSPAPVELLAAPATTTMPPAATERRPEPVATPVPYEASCDSSESNAGLVE